MTRQLRALLLSLALLAPFVALRPHVSAEPRDYVQSVVCAPEYAWDCSTAMSIVRRESGNDSQAVNPWSLCAGWWQIWPGHGYPLAALLDPVFNTRVAYELWLVSGWTPWRVQ
jgi:hypothetical protein